MSFNNSLSLNIQIPSSGKSEELYKNIIKYLSNLLFKIEYAYENERGYFMSISVYNIENVNDIEKFLDEIHNIQSNIRYSIMIYYPDKKWPSSIRINKKGKKISTKQQTKYLRI